MKTLSNQALLIFTIIAVVTLIYLLAPILTPFLLGALLAYLIDPVVKRMDKWHLPHLASVLIVFLVFFSILVLAGFALYPMIVTQLDALIALLPQIIEWTQTVGMPWLMQYINIESLKSSFSLPTTLAKSGWVVSTFVRSGFVAIHSLIVIILTPVVTFYLLRDWDEVLSNIKSLIPATYRHSAIQLAHDCDAVLSAFIRGQLLVMLCLALIYGIGLSIAGLKLGLVIGFVGGVLSIVPYLGSTFVLVASVTAAFFQFGFTSEVLPVVLVFILGQTIEGYILTPYLIGEKIGLHPVAVIFSVMAGATLFGFFGVLLALPVAAVLMATARFFRKRMIDYA